MERRIRMIKHSKLNKKCNNCPRIIDDRSNSGLCKSCVQLGKGNGMFGKRHSKTSLEKMSNNRKLSVNIKHHPYLRERTVMK